MRGKGVGGRKVGAPAVIPTRLVCSVKASSITSSCTAISRLPCHVASLHLCEYACARQGADALEYGPVSGFIGWHSLQREAHLAVSDVGVGMGVATKGVIYRQHSRPVLARGPSLLRSNRPHPLHIPTPAHPTVLPTCPLAQMSTLDLFSHPFTHWLPIRPLNYLTHLSTHPLTYPLNSPP